MAQVSIKKVQCLSPAGLHSMAYKEWGDPANPKVLVCVHGVTRISDDFDKLAAELSSEYRVICPDIVGRGRSDWLKDPQYYVIPQYANDMIVLLARLNATTVDWLGTSMGGLIGMAIAALPGQPIRKLILNDIGPGLNPADLYRIADYLGKELRWDKYEDAEAYVRSICATFGEHTEEEWHKLASSVLVKDNDGKWRRHYDVAMSDPFKGSTIENLQENVAMLWAVYDQIRCDTLVIRGAVSDLILPATVEEMKQRGPKPKTVELPGVGHAPMFMHDSQIKVVKEFLLG
jgi:pimeloyl-ACP methyl ester carboxylesterase